MIKKIILLSVATLLVFLFAGCRQLDVVGNTSIESFSAVLKAVPDKVSADEMVGGWALTAPDNSAKFGWSKDFSGTAEYDVMLVFDAKPFIDAGLDATKLPAGMVAGGRIIVGTALGSEKPVNDKTASPLAAYEQIVSMKRESVSYHMALDHFGIDLAGGNMFEWAKDMSKNDKDIVFVLNPQVFIDAGVDPSKVDGWVFAKVETMDMDGRTVEADKLLKPFDLK